MATLRFLLNTEGQSTIVDVEYPDGCDWATVRAALCDHGYPEHIAADGTLLNKHDVMGVHPLVTGAVLQTSAAPPPMKTGIEIVVESGPRQGVREPLTEKCIVLGRGHRLLGDDPLVSREHARVSLRHGEVGISDLASTGGIAMDGECLKSGENREWKASELLRIGGSALALHIEPPAGSRHAQASGKDANDSQTPLDVQWPQAEPTRQRSPARWLGALVPLPIAAGLAYWMHSPVLLAFMLLGPAVLLVTSWDERRHGRRNGRRARAALAQERAQFAADLSQGLRQERQWRREHLPAPHRLEAIARGQRSASPAPSGESLHLRLGHGSSPSCHTYRHAEARTPLTLHDAPVGIRLEPGLTFLHATSDVATSAILEMLAASCMVLGSPSGRDLHVVTPVARTARWAWVGGTRLQISESAPAPEPSSAQGRNPAGHVFIIDSQAQGARDLITDCHPQSCVVWIGPTPPPGAVPAATLATGYEASTLASGHSFTMDAPYQDWFPTVTRLMAQHCRDVAEQPTSVMPSVVEPSDLDAYATTLQWGERPQTDVPLGLSAGGQCVMLNLARHGPHALVAGTTGSGKSEALLGYLYALFARNSPEHLLALLIDYKGGATFGVLAEAPHVVGVVSDLDDGLGARALRALRAELLRRERLLAQAGYSSYDSLDHQAPPLPRLFVVVDEFRVLAEELPDFVQGLVRLAAVGRSLGIHLILATQRPGGVVTADMRANLDARLVLRVREKSDSVDVMDTPLGAAIPRECPGRAYLSVGGEGPVPVQTTYVSGPMNRAATLRVRVTEPFARADTDTAVSHPDPEVRRSDGPTYVEALVESAREAAHALPPPHRPLLPPLPDVLNTPTRNSGAGNDEMDLPLTAKTPAPTTTWQELTDASPQLHTTPPHFVPVARVDLPDAQAQVDVGLPEAGHLGFSGSSRSGRSTAVRRCAEAANAQGREVWWCGLHAPASASYSCGQEDPHELAGLLEFMATPPAPATIVIDDWDALVPTLARINRGMGNEDVLELCRTAHSRGINLLVTGGRALLSSRLAGILDFRVVLSHHDISDYSLAGLRPRQIPRRMPPGRGLILPHGHEIQFYLPDSSR